MSGTLPVVQGNDGAAVIAARSFGPVEHLEEGAFKPVTWNLRLGRTSLELPIGAYAMKEGELKFVATIDYVGLAAIVLVAAPSAIMGTWAMARVSMRWLDRR